MPSTDRWARWLLDRRDGGDPTQRERALAYLSTIQGRVLEGAAPLEGATVLDVGAGDGLIGLAALQRVGPDGLVIFTDISPALLEECRRGAEALGLAQRARFILAAAEDLAGVAAHSVDVVTTRSVLMYVQDKASAFSAMARVLRPTGRASLFEPINQLMLPEPHGRFLGYDLRRVADLADRVKLRFDGTSAEREAMTGFNDRDLVDLAVDAGFKRVRVECQIVCEPGSNMNPGSFQALLRGAPHPNSPTVKEAAAEVLSIEEQEIFLAQLERAFDSGNATRRWAGAYVLAYRT